jgi:Xaa-Pro aminopeptidase
MSIFVNKYIINLNIKGKLDEIAWVLNLRGNDISYNPVFFSYLLIDFTQEKIKA